MSEQPVNPVSETPASIIAQAKADIKTIQDFAGGLPLVEEKIKETRKNIEDAAAQVTEAATKFSTVQSDAETKASEMQTAQSELQEKTVALNTEHEALAEVVKKVTQLQTDANTAKKSVDDNVASIQAAANNFQALNTDTQQKATELQTQQSNVQNLLSAVETAHNKVNDYKEELLDEKTDANGNSIKSVKAKIDTLHSDTQIKFKEIETNRQDALKSFTALEEEMRENVEALLPGAGAAGLCLDYGRRRWRDGDVRGKPADLAGQEPQQRCRGGGHGADGRGRPGGNAADGSR